MTQTPPVKKNIKVLKINFAIIFTILVALATISIYWYNIYLEWKNKDLDNNISEKEARINVIKEDKNIQIYALIQDNAKILKKLKSHSQITKFISWMTYIEENYNLILEWFNYSNWIISTKARTNPEKVSNAYITTSSFIEKYRKDKNEQAIFKLPFISKVVWNSDISFNLKLEVKNDLLNNNLKK